MDELGRHLRSHRSRQPLVVHRIDRDTSGVVLFAKHARARQHLRRQFLRRTPERLYRTVVYGDVQPSSGTWRDRLVWDDRQMIQKETHARDPRGAEAISDYKVVERLRGATLLEVRLVTGKRNQIRLQARLRGHTLVGERRYVFGPEATRPIDFPRQALHAWKLTVEHPKTGKAITFEAPLPEDMSNLIEELSVRR
jgi:23S rRNA pseudouridine1911/1915/1917 synthase